MIIEFAKKMFRKKQAPTPDCMQEMIFKRNDTALSIGVESELQIINRDTYKLSNTVDELAATLNMPKNIDREAMMSTIEIITGVHANAHKASDEIKTVFTRLIDEAEKQNTSILACSYHPTAHHTDVRWHADERYQLLADKFQWLYRQWVANGMHIHIGMKDEKECMRYMNFFRNFVPHFSALAASSPFFQGENTGILSTRAIINQALPIAPTMHSITTWDELRQLVASLEKSRTIKNYKDLWWDLRPAPRYGTLELRMFDMPTNLQEQKAIVAFVHALAVWFGKHGDWLTQVSPPKYWVARENKWRAIRYGMEADLITDTDGATVTLRDDLEIWLGRIAPIVAEFGYEQEMAHLREIMKHGPAARRMQQVYARTGDMKAVVDHVVEEFRTGKPVYVEAVREEAVKPALKTVA